ncbi:MAG: radical SAM protein [Alphaproteobacteria bacterium]|nr:radical SAM protein [Alphaproteobacteria bacterium]NDG05347.1 radical SAM protein [Alphaproteobacteria bacterium]
MIPDNVRRNLRRKSAYVDHVQMHNGAPLFSWIDINLTELCNRACTFCPRGNPDVYPNQDLHISTDLIKKMADELRGLNYEGAVVFCGFGEPLLHPRVVDLAAQFGPDIRLEIVTSGDRLNEKLIEKLIVAGVDYFVISMYDGPQQIDRFHAMFKNAGFDEKYYILRDRWHNEEDQFGLKLTNRAGMVTVGNQEAVDVTKPCHYPAYSMTIDWNGDALLCVQDWNKKVKLGNAHAQSLLEIWHTKRLHKMRMKLACGGRDAAPCNGCNTDGTLHGDNHVHAWQARELAKDPVIGVSSQPAKEAAATTA